MAYPMIALTTDGTTFACASVSLTETGLAVLDDNGGRIGFVPYDSLEYVAPTAESRVTDAPMQVLTADGSTFGAASTSQAAKGIAALDESGSRIGFVPYDTLSYVLPESKTGPTLPADATPLDTVTVEEEHDGGGPVWAGDEERAAAEQQEGETDGRGSESEPGADEADDESDADESVDRSEDDDSDADEPTDAEEPSPEADAGDGDTDDAVWGGEPAEESERDAGDDGATADAEASTDGESDDDTTGDDRTTAAPEASTDAASRGSESGTESARPEEEVEESELVVDWSFGDE